MSADGRVVVTGVGLAVPGLADASDLRGTRREGGFDPAKDLLGRDLRHKDRGSRLAIRAARPALEEAGLLDGAAFAGPPDRTAVVVSSDLGILDSVCTFADVIAEQTVTGLSPMGLPQTSINVITGSVAIRYGLRGPNVTVTNGPSGGLDALHLARNLIAVGRAEVALVLGVEPAGRAAAKLLGEECVDAAVAVVLESAAHAAGRGCGARAELAGYAHTPRLPDAIARARGASAAPVGLWLLPERAALDDPGRLCDAAVRTSLDWLGRARGALGVLQCAAGVAHFDAGGTGAVLATAGGCGDGASAALVLTVPPGA